MHVIKAPSLQATGLNVRRSGHRYVVSAHLEGYSRKGLFNTTVVVSFPTNSKVFTSPTLQILETLRGLGEQSSTSE